MFAQLRARERRGGREGGLFFWRDRTQEVDFVADAGEDGWSCLGRGWTELPGTGDTVNLEFARKVMGDAKVMGGGVIARPSNRFPLANGFRAMQVEELDS